VAVRVTPFSALTTETWAFGTAAPLGSVTVPVTEAVSWASTPAETQIIDRRTNIRTRRDFIVDSMWFCYEIQ
jgi:hypothetical protein